PTRQGAREALEPLHSPWEEKPLGPRGRAISPCHVRYASAAKLRRCPRLAVHTRMGYAQKAASPADGRKHLAQAPSPAGGERGPPGDTIEGSIMDAKTGANIKTGKFVVGDRETTFPVYEGTIGPSVIDIGKFYAETGM